MNTAQINPGACEGALGYPGATRARSNASNAGSNVFKRQGAAVAPKPAGIGREKLALVHVARRDLELEEDIYRATLLDVAGVKSSRDLDQAGFLKVMARFESMGFRSRPNLGDREGFATPKQLDYIQGLFRQWLGREDDAALTAWIDKRYHVSALRFLDVVRAQKAIEGLKKMLQHKRTVAMRASHEPKKIEEAARDQARKRGASDDQTKSINEVGVSHVE
jgi:hypothetical protein